MDSNYEKNVLDKFISQFKVLENKLKNKNTNIETLYKSFGSEDYQVRGGKLKVLYSVFNYVSHGGKDLQTILTIKSDSIKFLEEIINEI